MSRNDLARLGGFALVALVLVAGGAIVLTAASGLGAAAAPAGANTTLENTTISVTNSTTGVWVEAENASNNLTVTVEYASDGTTIGTATLDATGDVTATHNVSHSVTGLTNDALDNLTVTYPSAELDASDVDARDVTVKVGATEVTPDTVSASEGSVALSWATPPTATAGSTISVALEGVHAESASSYTANISVNGGAETTSTSVDLSGTPVAEQTDLTEIAVDPLAVDEVRLFVTSGEENATVQRLDSGPITRSGGGGGGGLGSSLGVTLETLLATLGALLLIGGTGYAVMEGQE